MTQRIAALDTVVLIHAFRQFVPELTYPDVEREMSRRAKILLQNLGIHGTRIIVPSITVTEYLTGIEPQKHEEVIGNLLDQFEVPPFDMKAVSLAAKLWRTHRILPEGEQIDRIVLKADVMIVATARAFGATDFYSHDRRLRNLAQQAGLAAHDLPEHSEYLIPDAIDLGKKNKGRKSS